MPPSIQHRSGQDRVLILIACILCSGWLLIAFREIRSFSVFFILSVLIPHAFGIFVNWGGAPMLVALVLVKAFSWVLFGFIVYRHLNNQNSPTFWAAALSCLPAFIFFLTWNVFGTTALLRYTGNTMLPHIHNGAWVAVDLSGEPTIGDIVVFENHKLGALDFRMLDKIEGMPISGTDFDDRCQDQRHLLKTCASSDTRLMDDRKYFVLGASSGGGVDSRCIGCISEKSIVGTFLFVI